MDAFVLPEGITVEQALKIGLQDHPRDSSVSSLGDVTEATRRSREGRDPGDTRGRSRSRSSHGEKRRRSRSRSNSVSSVDSFGRQIPKDRQGAEGGRRRRGRR